MLGPLLKRHLGCLLGNMTVRELTYLHSAALSQPLVFLYHLSPHVGAGGPSRAVAIHAVPGEGIVRPGLFLATDRVARGFTLLELLVVVAIIGLLVGYVAPRYFGQIGKSEVATAKAQIDALDKALDQYRLDTGRYPGTDLGLNALVQRPQDEPKWNGPYLKKAVPLDPWGKPYLYRAPGEKADFDIVSLGKDGQPGGTGENADLSNH